MRRFVCLDELWPRGVPTSRQPPAVFYAGSRACERRKKDSGWPGGVTLFGAEAENSGPCLLLRMAQISSDETEQEPKTTSGESGAGETAETGNEGQAVPDPEQEPGCGDNNENGAGMDAVSGGLKPGDESLTTPGPGTADGDSIAGTAGTTISGPEESDNGGGVEKLSEPGGESPARGTEGSAPGLPGPEQRDDVGEKNTSAPPGERTKAAERAEHGGTKRRASVELTSSDGEPLSRVDSEDRSVKVSLPGTAASWTGAWPDPTRPLGGETEPDRGRGRGPVVRLKSTFNGAIIPFCAKAKIRLPTVEE